MADENEQERDADATEPRSRRAALIFVAALVAILAVVGIVAMIAGGGDDGEDDDGASSAELVCESVPNDGGTEDCPDEIVTEPADVEVATSEGDFTISLDTENWPATSTSFRHLVEEGFYDDNGFHRVVPGFVIQGGDPFYGDDSKVGSGGAGYAVDEEVPADTTYPAGTVAMAKTGTDPAGRSGSQFFVVSGDGGSQLTPDYAIAGTVAEGMETVEKIDALGQGDGPPSKPVTIESMTLVPAS